MDNSIGVGIITKDRPQYFANCLNSLRYVDGGAGYDHIVIVNDGSSAIYPTFSNLDKYNEHVITHDQNKGVGISKNDAMRYLMDKGCDHIFIIEDDVVIKKGDVFQKYIETAEASGILHLNYALGTPFNRKQKGHFDLYNRDSLDLETEPNPKLIFDYDVDTRIALYEHIAGMFSYYHRSVIENIGYIDEQYKNAWDHVDHTYQAIKAGFHPPFWYFADIGNSDEYLEPQKDSIKNSSMSKNTEAWMRNVQENAEKYRVKNGHYPAQTFKESPERVIDWIKQHKRGIT